MPKALYFSDCLEVMRNDIPEEFVDLIYWDPPFNSKRLYNAFMGKEQRNFSPIDKNTGRRFQPITLTGSGVRTGESGKSWRGIDPTESGRHWALPRKVMEEAGIYGGSVQEKLEALDSAGLVYWPKKVGGEPRLKWFSDQLEGVSLPDLWTDINPISSRSKEREGYPAQKPIDLLRRVIKASSSSGDLVLDPFCGCGTTIHAAHELGRHWIGIDICLNACRVIQKRLRSNFSSIWEHIPYLGLPHPITPAHELASIDKFRFEKWAASLVEGMEPNSVQRGDEGIDGRGRFPIRRGKYIDLVSQVKGGSTGPGDVQAFNGARQQAGAELGFFTCFRDRVTPRMKDAAVSAGRFMDVPRIQIDTPEDYFEGRKPRMPVAA